MQIFSKNMIVVWHSILTLIYPSGAGTMLVSCDHDKLGTPESYFCFHGIDLPWREQTIQMLTCFMQKTQCLQILEFHYNNLKMRSQEMSY